MTCQDQIQYGRIVHVGSSPYRQDNSIRKSSKSGSIEVVPGGVVGDYHFQYKLDYDETKRLHLNQFPELENLTKSQGGFVIQTHQISLFEIEEIIRLKNFSSKLSNLEPGMLGENITTQGIRLNEIRINSIIVINGIRLKVKAKKSFCRRLLVECPVYSNAPFLFIKQNVTDLGELRSGIMCQVLDQGMISVNDTLTVYPNPNLINAPWTNLPLSSEGKPTLDRVEYLPPNE